MKLGYWKIRGLAEPIRMLLQYAGIDYEEVVYEQGDAPGYDKSVWFDVKFTLGLEFPNLPYLIDGDLKLTQTISILHYLSAKTGLFPKSSNPADISRYDMIDHVILDFFLMGVRLCYSSPEDFAANKSAVVGKAKDVMKQFSAALGDKKFFAGNDITGTDFWMFEAIDRFVRLDTTFIEHGNLKKFMERIRELPQLQKYFTSPESTHNWALNNKHATFR
jgi:glutathione S-transferase